MSSPQAKWKRWIFVLLLFALFGSAIWWFASRERIYNGKPVSAWVRELKRGGQSSSNEAFRALIDIGPACLPALRAELRPRDNFFTRTYARLWPKLPRPIARWLKAPTPSRAERRATAAWALGEIGRAARSTVPSLLVALNDPDDNVRAETAQALRWIRCKEPAVIAALSKQLSDPSNMVRARAAEALWDMAPESQAALTPLTQLLHDPNLAYEGALCIQELGPLASNSIPDLVAVVKHGVAGTPPKQKFKRPLADQDDPSAHNRAMAAKALGRIGIADDEMLAALKYGLEYPKAWVRQNSAEATGKLGTNALSLMESLTLVLADTNPPAAQQAALALGAMGDGARDALPALTNLLNELPEPFATRKRISESSKWQLVWLKSAVARAIFQIDHENAAAATVLVDNATLDYEGRRLLAAHPESANRLLPRIEGLLVKTNGQTDVMIAELICSLDPRNPVALQNLKHVVDDTNHFPHGYAAFWYWKITGEAEPALQVMTSGLREPPSQNSQSFAWWLKEMGPAAWPAVPELKRALWHQDVFTRRNAGKALEKIDPATLKSLDSR